MSLRNFLIASGMVLGPFLGVIVIGLIGREIVFLIADFFKLDAFYVVVYFMLALAALTIFFSLVHPVYKNLEARQ